MNTRKLDNAGDDGQVASMREVAAMRQRELAATRTMCDQEVSSLRFQHSSDRMTYSQTLKVGSRRR